MAVVLVVVVVVVVWWCPKLGCGDQNWIVLYDQVLLVTKMDRFL